MGMWRVCLIRAYAWMPMSRWRVLLVHLAACYTVTVELGARAEQASSQHPDFLPIRPCSERA